MENDVSRERTTGAARNAATVLLAMLLFAAIAAALPPTPPDLPGDVLPTSEMVVVITAPSAGAVVNATTAVSYTHTAPSSLNCTLYFNDSPSMSDIAAPNAAVTRTVVLLNGTHRINVTCRNATLNVSSSNVVFSSVNSTAAESAVEILSPSANATPNVTFVYRHTYTGGAANCTARLDSGSARTKRNVAANANVSESYYEISSGAHTFFVSCANGAWNRSATLAVNVANDTVSPDTLVIFPKQAYPGATVSINGTFPDGSAVDVTVENPAGSVNTTQYIIPPSGRLIASYSLASNAKVGTYLVTAVRTDDETDSKNGTFTVSVRTPVLRLSGNKTNVSSSTVLVIGEQFYPYDNVSLTLVGGGTNVSYTLPGDSGGFTFTYYNLSPRQYELTAKSVAQPTILATLTFMVLLNTTPPVNTTLNTTNTTVIGPTTPPETNPVDDFSGSDTNPVETAPEPTYVPPEPQNPAPLPTVKPKSDAPSDSGSSSGLRWVIFLVAFVVIVGGAAGYFVYNGTLDISSPEAFKDSVEAMFSGGKPPVQQAAERPVNAFGEPVKQSAPAVGSAEDQTIKTFIYNERSKGFDDLTIRSGLISHGWDKNEVDAKFDEIYKEQGG